MSMNELSNNVLFYFFAGILNGINAQPEFCETLLRAISLMAMRRRLGRDKDDLMLAMVQVVADHYLVAVPC